MTMSETAFARLMVRRALFGLALVAVAIFPVTIVALGVLVDGDEVAAWLTPRVSAALNRDVSIGEAGVAVLPRPGVRLRDVRVGPSDAEAPSVIMVDEVHLEAGILPLFLGKVRIDGIRLRGLDVRLAISESGVSNFGDLVPESEPIETARRGPVSFRVDRVGIDEASLSYFDGTSGKSFAVTGGRGRIAIGLRPDGRWAATSDLSADSLHARSVGIVEGIVRTDAPSLSFVASGDAALDRIEIVDGSLQLWDESIDVSGSFAGLGRVDPTLDIRLASPDVAVARFASLIPARVRAERVPALEGGLDVRLGLRGRLRADDGVRLTGLVGLSGVGLRLGGLTVVSGMTGRVRLGIDSIRIDAVSGTLADGPFTLEGTVSREAPNAALVVRAQPDLEVLRRVGFRPAGVDLAGRADLRLDLSGPLDSLDAMDASGRATLTGVQADHEAIGVPLYVPSAELSVSGREVAWAETTLLVGDDPIVVSGRIADGGTLQPDSRFRSRLDLRVAGDRLDLERALPPDDLEPPVAYARIAFAHLGGREIDGLPARTLVERSGLSRPSRLPAVGSIEARLGELRYREHALTDVSVRIELADTVLTVRDASFASWGGQVRLDLRLGVGERVDEPFSLAFVATDVEAAPFFTATTPLGKAVTGTATVELEVSGTTDRSLMPHLESLRGEGVMTVRDGAVSQTGMNHALADFLAAEEWAELPAASWTTHLAIQDGTIDVERSELRGDLVDATLTGVVGLGGAVDVAIALVIPPDQLARVSLRRTGIARSVLDQLERGRNPLELGVRVSGTLEGPVIEPDATAAADRLASARR